MQNFKTLGQHLLGEKFVWLVGGESGCGHNQSREGAVVAKNEGGGSTLMMEYTKCSWNKEKRESVFRGSKSRIEV